MGQERIKKPDWLKVRLGGKGKFSQTRKILESHCLHTICESGNCPNQGDCWERGTATFMIGGDICTRSCKFCNTKTGKPLPLDKEEPVKIAESIRSMQLKYAVITSVDRDDLPDCGASHWVETIQQTKLANPAIPIEVLIPDFQAKEELLEKIADAQPYVIAHNMETVRRLTPVVRSAAKYRSSLAVLNYFAGRKFVTKSGIMLGLGETQDEVKELMNDLLAAGCFYLTIGQYLQPSRKHFPVAEYISPDTFDEWKETGLKRGFKQVVSAPLVRSSYNAENIFL